MVEAVPWIQAQVTLMPDSDQDLQLHFLHPWGLSELLENRGRQFSFPAQISNCTE